MSTAPTVAVSRDARPPARPPPIVISRLPADAQAILDEFGDLDLQVAAFKCKAKRHSDLRDRILSWYPDLPGDQAATAEGRRWNVHVTVRDNRREVTLQGKRKLHRLWGAAGFLARCKIALGELDAIAKDDHCLYVTEGRAGPRHLQALPRSEALTQAEAEQAA